MSDSAAPSTADAVAANPHDLLSISQTLPDEAFAIDDDEPGGSAAPQPARDEGRARIVDEDPNEDEPGEPVEDDEEGEEPAPQAEPEAEAPEDGAEEAEPEAKASAADQDDAKTVKIDGKDITIAEIKRGFLRQADYTRKTQEVALARQQIEGYAQQLQQGEQQLAGILNLAMEVVRANLPEEPDASLIDRDPVAYMRQERLYRASMQRIEQIQQAQAQVGQRTQQERAAQERAAQEELQQALTREWQAAQSKIPELADPAKRDTFLREASTVAGKHWGLNEADILGIQDHRAFLVLKDAIAYRKMQAAKPAAIAKAQAAPPIRPAPRPTQGTRLNAARGAMERLRREGSVEAAVATLPDSWFQV